MSPFLCSSLIVFVLDGNNGTYACTGAQVCQYTGHCCWRGCQHQTASAAHCDNTGGSEHWIHNTHTQVKLFHKKDSVVNNCFWPISKAELVVLKAISECKNALPFIYSLSTQNYSFQIVNIFHFIQQWCMVNVWQQWNVRKLFQVNAVLLNFPLIKESWKQLLFPRTIKQHICFQCWYNNKCFVNSKSAY